METYFFLIVSVGIFIYTLAVILLTALKWDWFSNHPEWYPFQKQKKLDREAYGTYSGTYLVNGIKGVRRAVFIKASFALICSVVLMVVFTGQILEERAEEKSRRQQAAGTGQTGEPVSGGVSSSSQDGADPSSTPSDTEEPEIVFGETIVMNQLELVLERAEFLPVISTGRFDKKQDEVWLIGEEEGSVLLTIMGTLTNRSERNLQLDTQRISVNGVWENESVTEGYMAASSHMVDEDNLELSPNKCAIVYFFLSVPKDMATSFTETGVPEFQIKILRSSISISREVLVQALTDALRINPRQGSYVEENHYVNEALGFTYIVPEGWRVFIRSSEEVIDPFRLSDEELISGAGTAEVEEFYDSLNYFRLMEAIQPETGAYLTIDAIPAAFLEGRSPEKFIRNYQDIYYYRLDFIQSGVDVNVFDDGSFVQELEGGTVIWGKLEIDIWNNEWDEVWDEDLDEDWYAVDVLDVYVGVFQRGDYLLLVDQYFLRSGDAADPIEIGEPVVFHE